MIFTNDGDHKKAEDIEDPDDECVDPGEYWDEVTAPEDDED